MDYIMIAITLIGGLLSCFFGYKWNKILIALTGFVVGYGVADFISTLFISEQIIVVIVSIGIGLIGSFIAHKLYLLGIFLLCFFTVFTICKIYIDDKTIQLIAGIIGGIITGIIGVKCVKPIVILMSSISGGTLIASIIVDLLNNQSILLVVQILIIVAGMIFQTKTNTKNS